MVKKQSRLYCRAVFMSFRRGAHTQQENQAIVKVEGVGSKDDATWYLGKRVAYVYRAKRAQNAFGHKTNYRTIEGKIINTHGSNGAVRAKFRHNLPVQALGAPLRVMLYPNRA